MCYPIIAISIKRGFKTGVNLLRQVRTFVLSPFFMQKSDGFRHSQMKGRENMTKQEVIELVKSGRLRGFLTPEAAKYAINIEEMGTYTGIVLVNPDMKEAAYPVFNLDRAMEKLQYIDTPEETAEILAGTINRFLQTAPKSSDININGLREKLSNYNAAKPYIFMDAVSHKYNNDRAVIHEINGMKFVPKIMISDEERMRAVSPVPKDWLIEQGISEDRLIDDAISNTANITHASIKSINEVISSIDDSLEIPYLPEMIVVTSESKAGGASVILDDNVRQQVSSLYEGKDFFVIPSSTHEVITVPVNNFFTPDSDTLKGIMGMISEVNDTLDNEEILGYSVSIYNAKNHTLEKGTEYCINKQIDKVREYRIDELKEMRESNPDIRPDDEHPKFNM